MFAWKNALMSKEPQKILYRKETMHKSYCYSMFIHCSFNATKNKLHCYRGTDCMERFCKDLASNRNNQLWKNRNDTID